ncbi:CDP-glycerol:glycerophosphate glycerophosphotransferase [Geodermatophilus sp. SYSU D00758]
MRPQFSVISAIYNVAEYIEEYLASLERQTYGLENLEIILVDDGSTDASGQIAEQWAHSSKARVRYLRQANAGQGAARNAGIELATGVWVSFVDPDDVLSDTYFEEVAGFLAAQRQEPDMLASRPLTFTDDVARHVDRHPLRANFRGKNKVVDLVRFPDRIHLHGPTAFLRLDRIRSGGIRFDARIRPTFEDAHIVGAYLLSTSQPTIGFIRTAEYYYRKRVDGSSSVQAGWVKDEKYTLVLRHGHLDLLQRAVEQYGAVPVWLQNTVLYDLFWYFKTDVRLTSPIGAIGEDVLREFQDLCDEIFAHIDVETILSFRIQPVANWLRLAVIGGYKNKTLRPDFVVLDRLDERQRLVRARYMFSGERPAESFYWRGLPIEPAHQKSRSIKLLGRTLAYERIAWLPADGTLRVELEGRPVPMSTKGPVDLPYTLTPDQLWRGLGHRAAADMPLPRGRRARLRHLLGAPLRFWVRVVARLAGLVDREEWTARISRRLAKTRWARKRYADAWVLMDRRGQAQDNAEHLYAYIKNKRPAINSWFVLERGSPDWSRLSRRGFKLIPYGSMRWRVLLLSAKHLISSHCDVAITNPLPVRLYGKPSFAFTFLQHGVTKDDISRWLNTKNIELMLTATRAETRSISGDETPYILTSKEVRQTGFPRHDRLIKMSDKVSGSHVDQILVMPTWRHSLTESMPDGLSAEQRLEVFLSSDYARHWLAFLQSEELAEIARRHGARIALLPHPHPGMAGLLRGAGVPEYVQLLDWKDIDFQDVLVRSLVFITDYTSAAFDAALLRKPVLYYQFDRTQFFGGGHQWRRGYFDYDRDGFGPIALSHDDAIAGVEKIAANDFGLEAEFAQRMDSTFDEVDGNACYRVFKAISQLDRPVRARPVGAAAEPAPSGQGDPVSELGLGAEPADDGMVDDSMVGSGTSLRY